MSPTKATRGSGSPKIKLRASCDGCYLTKIKCDKARPMCSRCLTYGIDCVYSPSSRSGRAKRDSENRSQDYYESGPSSQIQDETYGDTHQTFRSPFLYIPPTGFSDNESSYDNTTIPTPELGQYSDQYPLGDGYDIDPERDLLAAGSAMESLGSSFWFQSAETPPTKVASTFPEIDLPPLTSDLLFSAPNMPWDQFSDGQLDFTSYNTPTLHFTPRLSPTTSIGGFTPEDCTCLTNCHQDSRVLHNHSCPNFRQRL